LSTSVRLAVVIARTLTRPALICGIADEIAAMPNGTSPVDIATAAGAPPL
jgi:hypothetical protein